MHYWKVFTTDGEFIDSDWADTEYQARETVSCLSAIPIEDLVAKRAHPGT